MHEDRGNLLSHWSKLRAAETVDNGHAAGDLPQSRLEILRAKVAQLQEEDAKQSGEESVLTGSSNHVAELPQAQAKSSLVLLLTGKLAAYLSQKDPRADLGEEVSSVFSAPPPRIEDAQTGAAVAVSLVLAGHLMRYASTPFSERCLNDFRDRLLKSFSQSDTVRIEIEAHALLNWFANAMNQDWQPLVPESQDDAGEAVRVAMIERAIEEKRDLIMHYYTSSRADFSMRRITPLALEAEKYLIAFCHLRQEERIFRLSRIVRLSWAGASDASRLAEDADEPGAVAPSTFPTAVARLMEGAFQHDGDGGSLGRERRSSDKHSESAKKKKRGAKKREVLAAKPKPPGGSQSALPGFEEADASEQVKLSAGEEKKKPQDNAPRLPGFE